MSRALFTAWRALEKAKLSRVIVRLEPREVSDGEEWFPQVVAAWDDDKAPAFGIFGWIAEAVWDAAPGQGAVLLALGSQPRRGIVETCGCDPWDESACGECGGTGWVWTDTEAEAAS